MSTTGEDPTPFELSQIAALLQGGRPDERIREALGIWDRSLMVLRKRAHERAQQANRAEERNAAWERIMEGTNFPELEVLTLDQFLAGTFPKKRPEDRLRIFRAYLHDDASAVFRFGEAAESIMEKIRSAGFEKWNVEPSAFAVLRWHKQQEAEARKERGRKGGAAKHGKKSLETSERPNPARKQKGTAAKQKSAAPKHSKPPAKKRAGGRK